MAVKIEHSELKKAKGSYIYLDASDLDKKIRKLCYPRVFLKKLRNHALRKTARWAASRVVVEVANSLDIPARIIREQFFKEKNGKKRIHLNVQRLNDGRVKIWIGLKPVGLHRLNPKKMATGIKAGRIMVPGGFMALGVVFKRRGDTRLKIDKQSLEVYSKGKERIDNFAVQIGERLHEEFNKAYEAAAYK